MRALERPPLLEGVSLLALYDARTPADVLSLDARTVFGRLGLESQLSMTRRNGLWSMIDRIRQHAARLA